MLLRQPAEIDLANRMICIVAFTMMDAYKGYMMEATEVRRQIRRVLSELASESFEGDLQGDVALARHIIREYTNDPLSQRNSSHPGA